MRVQLTSFAIQDKLIWQWQKLKVFMIKTPGWKTWGLGILAWSWILVQQSMGTVSHMHAHHMHANTSLLSEMSKNVKMGLLPWTVMVVAMMFPLLNEQVRHVHFSVPRSKKSWAQTWFLAGYVLVWAFVGLLVLCFQGVVNSWLAGQSLLFTYYLATLAAFISALLAWLPVRVVLRASCNMTMPIRIQGWLGYQDSMAYGTRTGLNCARTCAAPMLAMVFAHHSLWVMAIITGILLYERYRLPHTSRKSAYAWLMLTLILLVLGLLS